MYWEQEFTLKPPILKLAAENCCCGGGEGGAWVVQGEWPNLHRTTFPSTWGAADEAIDDLQLHPSHCKMRFMKGREDSINQGLQFGWKIRGP